MSRVQVLTTNGWHDYCAAGIATDIKDASGNVLHTGDVVEIVDMQYGADLAQAVGVAMVVCDQRKAFIGVDDFFVAGWFSRDWTDGSYVLRQVDYASLPSNAHHRLVD